MGGSVSTGEYDLVAVANRLPVDFTVGDDGSVDWSRSPGGLVTALEPMMQAADGAWIGWSCAPDLAHDPFDAVRIRCRPISPPAQEIALYYRGFAKQTPWPLYHAVLTA